MRAAVPDTTHKRFRQSANKAKNKRAKRRVKHPEEYWINYICQKTMIADRKAEVRSWSDDRAVDEYVKRVQYNVEYLGMEPKRGAEEARNQFRIWGRPLI